MAELQKFGEQEDGTQEEPSAEDAAQEQLKAYLRGDSMHLLQVKLF